MKAESKYHANEASRFTGDTEDHGMTVLHDDGIYRHLRFQKPGTGMYHFDLVTWPGYLTVSGDMGCYTFSRVHDMFDFFAGSGEIDLRYWAEKSQGSDDITEYAEAKFAQKVRSDYRDAYDNLAPNERADIWAAIESDVLTEGYCEATARAAIDSFRIHDFEFFDTWDWDLKEYSSRFIWICFAIRAGCNLYRATRVVTA